MLVTPGSFGGKTIEAGPRYSGVRSKQMKNLVTRFAKDESGATAIEYGLIAALISVVIIGVLSTLGTTLNTKFETIQTCLENGVCPDGAAAPAAGA